MKPKIWLRNANWTWLELATDDTGTLDIPRIASRVHLHPETVQLGDLAAYEGITIAEVRDECGSAAGQSKVFPVLVYGEADPAARTEGALPSIVDASMDEDVFCKYGTDERVGIETVNGKISFVHLGKRFSLEPDSIYLNGVWYSRIDGVSQRSWTVIKERYQRGQGTEENPLMVSGDPKSEASAGSRRLRGLKSVLDSANPSSSKAPSKPLQPLLSPDFQLFVKDCLILRWENKVNKADMAEPGSYIAAFRMHCLLQKLQEELVFEVRVVLYKPLKRIDDGEVTVSPEFVRKEIRALNKDKFTMLQSLYASIAGSKYLIQLKSMTRTRVRTILDLLPVGDPRAKPVDLKQLENATHDMLHGLADFHE